MDNLSIIINFMVKLEALLNEKDEWAGAHATYSFKRDILRRYGAPSEELQETVQELEERVNQSADLLEGTEKELMSFTSLDDPELARELLIKIKAVLNSYAESIGKEFILTSKLSEMSSEDILAYGTGIINNDNR